MSQQIGNYRIIQKLGEGGMGTVYLAEHGVIGRQAAIKLLHPEMSANSEAVSRFFNEARATARIRHTGIVEVLDCGTLPSGQAYIVMERLQGETLGSYLKRYGKLSDDTNLARAIVRQIATAVGTAHARGIVHRDLKPENIFLSSDGGASDIAVIKILDFGIAKLTGGQMPTATTTSQLLGTPFYISPEQCTGAKDLDQRADIYSLGCIAFELFTGAPVFQADSLAELIAAHMFKEPPLLNEIEPTVPVGFADLVRRMLAKLPQDRPGKMEEIVAAIDGAGVAGAMRGDSVVLSARPLEPARPIEGPVSVRGIATLGSGGSAREGHVADEPTGSALAGLASEMRGDAQPLNVRGRIRVAAVAGAVTVAATVLFMVARPQPRPSPPTPVAATAAKPAVAEPSVVEVDVEHPPAGLSVTVDGLPSRLPLSLPRGPESHTLVFQADGYEPLTRTLDASKSRTLVLDMQRKAAPAPLAKPAPAPAKPAAKHGSANKGKRRGGTDLFLDI